MVIRIRRKGALCNMAVPYKICFNGEEQGMVRNKQSIILSAPDQRFAIQITPVGDFFQFHKMATERVIFPRYCHGDAIDCEVISSLRPLGLVTFGILQPIVEIRLKISY